MLYDPPLESTIKAREKVLDSHNADDEDLPSKHTIDLEYLEAQEEDNFKPLVEYVALVSFDSKVWSSLSVPLSLSLHLHSAQVIISYSLYLLMRLLYIGIFKHCRRNSYPRTIIIT